MFVSPLVLASILAVAEPPAAPAAPVTSTDPQSIVLLLQSEGYKARLEKDGDGDPKIVSAANGASFVIFFYDCSDHKKCESIQFRAAYATDKDKKLSADKMSEFNQKWRIAKAYLDPEQDPAIDFDVIFGSSLMPAEMFAEVLNRWSDSMGQFQKHIGR